MLGDLNMDDPMCRIVSEHTNSVVVNIEYRLAPEHKAPTQLEDSWKVYKWVSRDNTYNYVQLHKLLLRSIP